MWQFQRGLTSCLFLLLSGFAFSVATARHWASHLSPSRALVRRLRRFALFIALGYAMRIPVAPLRAMASASDAAWRTLLAVDVLQLIGVTFIAVQLLVIASRSRRVFSGVAIALALALTFAAPAIWSTNWEPSLPRAIAPYP